MKSHSSLFLLAALGVMSAGAAQAVDTSAWKCEKCPYPSGTSASVDVGVALVSDSSARFGDYTGLQRDGANLVLGGEVSRRGPDGYFANVQAANLGLGSRSLSAESGREGLYSLRLRFAEIPRHLTDDARTPFLGNGGGVLTLPAGYPAGNTAAMPLATTLQPVELGYNLKSYDLGGTLIGGEHWTWRANLRRDTRDGTRGTAGSFFVNAAQLAAPVDQHTDEFTLSASYTSAKIQATLSYMLSQFRNDAASLTWSNPFLPVVPGATRGQLALAPNNQLNQVSGTAGYDVTPTIRASADFAVGRLTQNAAYLDPTLNAGLAATVPALPASSLDGRVDTFNGSARVTATPLDGLRLQASVVRDVRENRTSVQAYPIVTTDMFLQPGTRSNTPFSFWQDRYKLSADYRGAGGWKVAAGVERDDKERTYAEVVTTRETTVWARASAQPLEGTTLALKLARADRSISPYGTATWFGAPENPLLRKYNLADRQRDSVGARADIAIGEKVNLGLSADFARDDYSQSVIGLQEARNTNVGADLAVALSEQTQLHAYVQSERVRSLQAGSQGFAAPDWAGRGRDRFEVLGFGLKHTAMPDKLDVGGDIVFSRSRSQVTLETVTIDPPFPTARTAQDSIRLFANYKISDKLWVNTNLWYQVYDAQDWHFDGVLPATVGNLLSFGTQPSHYAVGLVQVVLRYRF
jgi:MtrB/PioB family decaheme-associated outer membrane protein